MSGQGILNSVFSCSSAGAKTFPKRKLRQTRSLDPALMRNYGTEVDERGPAGSPLSRTPADHPKRSTAWDLPLSLSGPAQPAAAGNIFSPKKWLQKSVPQVDDLDTFSYSVWKSGGDFAWRSVCGRCFQLKAVPLQSLSELERVRLQEVAFIRLLQDYNLSCHITIPKDGQKRKKSLRKKLDYLGKEKKDKEYVPQAFGVPLQQVIANDRWLKLRQDGREDQRESTANLASFLLHLTGQRASHRHFYSSNSSLSSASETNNEPVSPVSPEAVARSRRRGGMSVDSITDLDDGQSRLLEALQLSLPAEPLDKKDKKRDKKLSLNPIYRQVPRVLELCCQHLEKYGLQTVGIFRVGSSKKRVRQLREEFDQGVEVILGPEHSVHDVAALLKEFLRDMPDPLLTRELYTAFINCPSLDISEQNSVLQLLICLLPACNSDTLQRLLHFLSTVANHAEDTVDSQGEQVPGNKMTALNLATIFGPNVLHKQKNSEKEFSVQRPARAEESAAVISVVQRMITSHESLFMIPAELQHEVLLSLLETDCDVVDYLLRRRKTSHSEGPAAQEPEPDPGDSFSSGEHCSSTDSNKASSGEVSPYENNSPTLSHWLPAGGGGVQSPERLPPAGHFRIPTPPPLTHTAACEKTDMWGTWHATLKSGFHGNLHTHTGSDGILLDSVFSSSSEALRSHRGNMKTPIRRTHTCPTEAEDRPHPSVTRAYSSPERDSPLDQSQHSLTTSPWKLRNTMEEETRVAPPTASLSPRPPPPYPGLKRTPPTLLRSSGTYRHSAYSCPPNSQGAASICTDISDPAAGEYQDWQRDKWQVWQLLSSDSVDTLPETLV
ncbi:rho GTPase-activating protein 6-like isoform X2 [Pygocentrus nattereri]|uniref:rho GTPase-activating protein 6-like isoform X2 n=1 Tax=Pygocentrus nattereri TaxID=42514 RepID=UPI0018911F08|nr:rho GTPase-activating protein 6-like isoform X2 [Pygocentrus nattereri]